MASAPIDFSKTEISSKENKPVEITEAMMSEKGYPVTLALAARKLIPILTDSPVNNLLKRVDIFAENLHTFESFMKPLSEALAMRGESIEKADQAERRILKDGDFIASATNVHKEGSTEALSLNPSPSKEEKTATEERLMAELLLLKPLNVFGSINEFITSIIANMPELKPEGLTLSEAASNSPDINYEIDPKHTKPGEAAKNIMDTDALILQTERKLGNFKRGLGEAAKAFKTFNEAIGESGSKADFKKAFADFCKNASYFTEAQTAREPGEIMESMQYIAFFIEGAFPDEYTRLFEKDQASG